MSTESGNTNATSTFTLGCLLNYVVLMLVCACAGLYVTNCMRRRNRPSLRSSSFSFFGNWRLNFSVNFWGAKLICVRSLLIAACEWCVLLIARPHQPFDTSYAIPRERERTGDCSFCVCCCFAFVTPAETDLPEKNTRVFYMIFLNLSFIWYSCTNMFFSKSYFFYLFFFFQ